MSKTRSIPDFIHYLQRAEFVHNNSVIECHILDKAVVIEVVHPHPHSNLGILIHFGFVALELAPKKGLTRGIFADFASFS